MHFKKKTPWITNLFIVIVTISASLNAQSTEFKKITMNDAVKSALTNNPLIKNADLKIDFAKNSKTIHIELGSPTFIFEHKQNRAEDNTGSADIRNKSKLTILWNVSKKYNENIIKLTEAEQKLTEKQMTAETKIAYTYLLYQLSRLSTIKSVASFYEDLVRITGLPYDTLDTCSVRRSKAETSYASIQNAVFQAEQDLKIATSNLEDVAYLPRNCVPADSSFELYAIEIQNSGPEKFYPASYLAYWIEKENLAAKVFANENQKLFKHKTKIAETKIYLEISKNELVYYKSILRKKIETLKIQLDQLFVHVSYYRENALPQSNLLINNAMQKIQHKEISYLQFFEQMETALNIQLNYLKKINAYNLTAIELESYID